MIWKVWESKHWKKVWLIITIVGVLIIISSMVYYFQDIRSDPFLWVFMIFVLILMPIVIVRSYSGAKLVHLRLEKGAETEASSVLTKYIKWTLIAMGIIFMFSVITILYLSHSSRSVQRFPPQIAGDEVPEEYQKSDTMDMNVTILSLTKEGETTPDDKAKIRVDEIHYYSRDPAWERIRVGDELEVEFMYSARPAMIQHFVTTPPKAHKKRDGRLGVTEIKKEGDMFIYKRAVWHEGEEDITLPGVKEGDNISFGALYSLNYVTKEMKIIIPEYEVLSDYQIPRYDRYDDGGRTPSEWSTCVSDSDCSLVDLDCGVDCNDLDDIVLNKLGQETIYNWKSIYCSSEGPSCAGILWGALRGACSNGTCSFGVNCQHICQVYSPYLHEDSRNSLNLQLARADTDIDEAFKYCECT